MVKAKPKPRKPQVASVTPLYVLSDSTGNLARHMVASFLTQFPAKTFDVQFRPFISEPGRLADAFALMTASPGMVLHAVVAPELKEQIASRCGELGITCCDMTGTIVDFLAKAAGVRPLADHELLHPVDPVYCSRINAMSFTLEHDDGLGVDHINNADIVLAGVSRTGKTPVSIYLAMQGYRVANVALAMQSPVPKQLRDLAPGKVVGLTIDATNLAEIRARRQTAWRMAETAYSDPEVVQEELDWSRKIFKGLNCPVVNVTDQAIEETAARVLDLLSLSKPAEHADEELF